MKRRPDPKDFLMGACCRRQQAAWKVSLACCLAFAAAGCAPSVRVITHPVDLVVEHPKQPIDMGDNRRAEGLTEWFFHCRPKVEVDAVVDASGYLPVAKVTVSGAQLEIGLTVKQRLVDSTSPQLIEHEGGHVQICKRIYAGAEAEAKKACRQIIGKQFTGQAATSKLAIEMARQEAAQQLCRAYLYQTARRADYVSDIYDRMTAHAGVSTGSQQAVEDAFRRAAVNTTAPVTIK